MPFPYYDNLSAAQKRIYRKSDAIQSIPLENPSAIHPVVVKLKKSLEDNKRRDVAKHSSEICRLVCEGMKTEPLLVKISSKRPSSSTKEYHGLYEWTDGETPVLTVWMKTAAKGQVVAFKSFLRTILHELCHHLDYTYFNLEDSFHTEGFFKRESSLYRQIVPSELQKREPRRKKLPLKKKAPRKKIPPKKSIRKQKREGPEQTELF
jgi:hypothetical protein